MRSDRLAEITIKVPSPFEGVDGLGFSARYPEQSLLGPLRDVPLWIEGPAEPTRRLANRLRLLHQRPEGPFAWTEPILLTDEVVVIAFRDRSLEAALSEGPSSSLNYVLNLVRPVVFPFLSDCAEVAHIRLSEQIEMSVQEAGREIAELMLRVEQIVAANGEDLLSA
jgi:hypothetical protein